MRRLERHASARRACAAAVSHRDRGVCCRPARAAPASSRPVGGSAEPDPAQVQPHQLPSRRSRPWRESSTSADAANSAAPARRYTDFATPPARRGRPGSRSGSNAGRRAASPSLTNMEPGPELVPSVRRVPIVGPRSRLACRSRRTDHSPPVVTRRRRRRSPAWTRRSRKHVRDVAGRQAPSRR